ncbi:MAG: ATP-dependent Clp protease ATP-binding subunit ClpX, partial [Pseudomonadota bacterium]
ESVELKFTDDALRSIAEKAIERKTGARGLRSILEDVLLDPMFELPGDEQVQEIVVNEEVISGEAKPLYIYTESSAEATAS